MSTRPLPDSWPGVCVSTALPLIQFGICKLTWKTGPDDSNDVRVLDVGFQDQGSNAVDDDNGFLVHGCDGFDEVVAVVPWVEVLSVAGVALDGDVAFSRVGVDVDDCDLGILSCRCTLLCIVVR